MFACEGCGTPTDPTTLLISRREDRSRVCGTCAAEEQQENTRRGIVSQYKKGAIVVLFVVLALLLKIFIRAH